MTVTLTSRLYSPALYGCERKWYEITWNEVSSVVYHSLHVFRHDRRFCWRPFLYISDEHPTHSLALSLLLILYLLPLSFCSAASVSVYLSLRNAPSFQGREWLGKFISGIAHALTSSASSGQVRMSRSSGQGQDHRSKKREVSAHQPTHFCDTSLHGTVSQWRQVHFSRSGYDYRARKLTNALRNNRD